jgi:tetratricopeptide (TPR) repeat protein
MAERKVSGAGEPDEVQTKLASAVALYQQRKFAEAQAMCELVLGTNPKQFDAIHLLGVIAAHARNFERAVELFSTAIEINPADPAPYGNRGNAQRSLKQFDQALASYDQAIALKPDAAEAYANRGNVFGDLQQFEAALASYDLALRFKPTDAGAHFNRGNVLGKLRRVDAAIASYDQAIALRPGYVQAWYNRGIAHHECQQREAALVDFEKVIALKPDHAKAYSSRGLVLLELKQSEAAIESYDQAIRLNPNDAQTYYNRGTALLAINQLEAAVASYDQAIAINPNHDSAYSNRGTALNALGKLDAAIASWDRAISLYPEFKEALWNKGLALLLNGDFEQGWPLYEWRLKNPQLDVRIVDSVAPRWSGIEPLEGRSILLYSEQGYGDTIQFIRYARLVAERGARVIASVPHALMRLCAEVDGVSDVIALGSVLPEIDFQCSLMSLPLAFGTTLSSIPSQSAYLKCDSHHVDAWNTRLGPKTKPRVGIVWSGSAGHVNDRNRSLTLTALTRFLPQGNGIQIFSLQRELRDVDQAVLNAHPEITHFGDALVDFTDTAALCQLMDVVISVDTSVAHLSGALGKPTWILLPFVPDWRWLLDRDDSPWYPMTKLYRQNDDRQWSGVLERVKTDLLKLAQDERRITSTN